MDRIASIDGDVLPYTTCFACMRDGVNTLQGVQDRVDEYIRVILEKAQTPFYILYLSGKTNFRDKIAVTVKYKDTPNRKVDKPAFFYELRSYLKTKYHAVTVEGAEADDALALTQCKLNGFSAAYFSHFDKNVHPDIKNRSVICSTDKDLKQVAGLHLNIKTFELVFVTGYEAHKNLWLQVLTGDSVDNIKGIEGIGPAKAAKILDGVMPVDYGQAVLKAYKEKYGNEGVVKYKENFYLVKMLTYNPKFYLPAIQQIGKDYIEYEDKK